MTDGLGNTIMLVDPAQKVVSLAPSNTEILYALEAGSQVVGRDEFSDYPEEAKSLPSVGGSFGEYNPEAIVALKPDLVLAAEINPPELVQSLTDLGLTVYYLKNPTTLEGMYDNLVTVGALVGRSDEAANLIDSLEARVTAVDQKLVGVADKPLAFYELDSTDPSAPFTAGPGTFVDLLIQRAGGTSVGSTLGSAWAQISVEELISVDPDMILLGDSAYGISPESVGQRAGWDGITAVMEGKVYPFDDNLVSRPGPRLVDGYEQLAKLLHPELFK
jgi:iron complex transport system substrate-binding protein